MFILKDIQDMAKDKQTLCDVIKENGEYHIDFCEFLRTMLEFGNAFEQSKAAIDTQVKTATSVKNILCRGQPGCATGAKPVKGWV